MILTQLTICWMTLCVCTTARMHLLFWFANFPFYMYKGYYFVSFPASVNHWSLNQGFLRKIRYLNIFLAQESKRSTCLRDSQTWTCFWISPLLWALWTKYPSAPLFVSEAEDSCWSGQPCQLFVVNYCVSSSVIHCFGQVGVEVHLLLVCSF